MLSTGGLMPLEGPRRPDLLVLQVGGVLRPETFSELWQQRWLPNISRLKRRGVTFQDAFSATGGAASARASLFAGKVPGEGVALRTSLGEERQIFRCTFTALFRQLGYEVRWSDGADCIGTATRTLRGNDPRFLPRRPPPKPPAEQPVCRVVFLDAKEVEPVVPGRWERELSGPESMHEDLTDKPRVQSYFRERRDLAHPFEEGTTAWLAEAAARLVAVDRQIGLELTRHGSDRSVDDTVVVLAGAWGEAGLSHGLRGARFNAYDATMRVPLVISARNRWKGGRVVRGLVSVLDVLPTLLSIAGSDVAEWGQVGRDLTPLLEGSDFTVRDDVVFASDDVSQLEERRYPVAHIRAVRTRCWKYVVTYAVDGRDADWELYDLDRDPQELRNLAGRGRVRDVEAGLASLLAARIESKGLSPGRFQWPPSPTESSRGGVLRPRRAAWSRDRTYHLI